MPTSVGESVRASDWPLCLLAVALTTCAFAPFALVGVDPHHDGIVLKPALDVLAGQAVFRDTFSQYGGGLPYLQAASLWAFGPTLAVLRLSAVAVYALSAGLLVGAWRLLLPRGLVVLTLLVWLALPGFYQRGFPSYAWSSVYALLFQAAAMFGLVRAIFGFHPMAYGVASGLACALAFSCRQPVGGVTAVAVLAGLVWAARVSPDRRAARQALVGYVIGLTVSMGAGAAFLASSGSVDQWYGQTIDWPRRWAFSSTSWAWALAVRTVLVPMAKAALPWWGVAVAALLPLRWLGGGMSRSRRALAWAIYALVLCGAILLVARDAPAHLPPANWIAAGIPLSVLLFVVASTVATVARGGATSVREIAAVGASCVAIVSWLQYYPLPCPLHIWWALAPSLGVALYAAWRASGERTLVTAVVTVLLLIPLGTFQARSAWRKATAPYARIEGLPILAGMRVSAGRAEQWRQLAKAVSFAVQVHPNAPMLVEGRDALFAALVTNLKNPGPMFVEWNIPGIDYGERRAAFITTERPLVFQQITSSPAVARALTAGGYRRTFRSPMGSLLVPGIP